MRSSIIEGDVYFAVGVLQGYNGIEKWTYTGDRYDIVRLEQNNVFKTEQEALDFKAYMNQYNTTNGFK